MLTKLIINSKLILNFFDILTNLVLTLINYIKLKKKKKIIDFEDADETPTNWADPQRHDGKSQ